MRINSNLLWAGLFLAMFSFACGDTGSDSKAEEETTEQQMQDESGMEHEGHDHDGHDHGDQMSDSEDKSGPEYTSRYICPMHCEGSGGAEPGICPVCGMDYVLNEDYQDPDSIEHEGHDHEGHDHEGHDHDHEG